jgi:hypothetical protein
MAIKDKEIKTKAQQDDDDARFRYRSSVTYRSRYLQLDQTKIDNQ